MRIPEDFYIMSALSMDAQYLDTLSMKLAAGRDYSHGLRHGRTESIILNESAVKALGWGRGSDRQGLSDGPRANNVPSSAWCRTFISPTCATR